jgi:hypothetical protein
MTSPFWAAAKAVSSAASVQLAGVPLPTTREAARIPDTLMKLMMRSTAPLHFFQRITPPSYKHI